MNNLLAIEWMKVRKYRTFWILVGFFALLLPLWNYSISNGFLKVGVNSDVSIINEVYSFKEIWGNLGYWASYFVVIVTILTIIITTNEFTFRTNRQNIIDGWTRLQFFHSKCLLVLSLAIFTTVYVFIVGLLIGISNDSISNFPGNINSLFYVFVLSLNYYSFGLLLGILFKRSGISIGLFFLYSFMIETILRAVLSRITGFNAGNFLPLQSSDELLPFPLVDIAKTMLQLKTDIALSYYVIASFAWIIIYYLIGRFRLLKSDW